MINTKKSNGQFEPSKKQYMYILISGIPLNFHTSDLRNFFSYSIENESFFIFNYRHRPHSSNKYNVCICKIKSYKFDELVKLYDKKNWLNSCGLIQTEKCHIIKIKICNNKDLNENDENSLSEEDIKKLLEFRKIPNWMPQGNVGTPNKTFIKYINQCIMPTSLIAKLGINLKAVKKNKKYSDVQFDYDNAEFHYKNNFKNNDRELEVAQTANGHSISVEMDDDKKIKELNYKNTQEKIIEAENENEIENKNENENNEDDDEIEEWDRHEALHDDVTKQDRTSPYFFENEIELKWEKGGSGLVFYTDENFWKDYENKDFDAETADDLDIDMSVYYEPNSGDKDSLDLIGINRETMMRNGADKNLFDDEKRDFNSKINPFKSSKKNKFEKSKGFGRLHLEKLGWIPGQPVGNPKRHGLVEALDGSDGKQPADKSGIGYHGDKVDKNKLIEMQKLNRLREHRNSPYYIATKYDDDPSKPDSLLKRFDPSMKYRSSTKKT